MRKIPTIRFGSCGHLAKSPSPSWIISLILKSFVASFLVITTFKTPKKISPIPRVECPVQLFISPWFRFGLGGAHPNSLVVVDCGEVVYNMDVPWDFLLLSLKKKTYCTTGNYNTIVFFCDFICCVCFFFTSKNPEFPNGWNVCQQQQTASGQQFPRSIPGWHTVPSSVARAVVVASPCGSNETSILASVGWVEMEGGSPPPAQEGFPMGRNGIFNII